VAIGLFSRPGYQEDPVQLALGILAARLAVGVTARRPRHAGGAERLSCGLPAHCDEIPAHCDEIFVLSAFRPWKEWITRRNRRMAGDLALRLKRFPDDGAAARGVRRREDGWSCQPKKMEEAK
jgi:hypothetical protein